ncbi:TPA: hypothetical protein I8005_001633 [Legionella pneumophila]|nr:hypothetical protein [Legionella pneumophila]
MKEKISTGKTLLMLFLLILLIVLLRNYFVQKFYVPIDLFFSNALGYSFVAFAITLISGGLLSIFMKSRKLLAYWMGFFIALIFLAINTVEQFYKIF